MAWYSKHVVQDAWRVRVVAFVAKRLGVLVHIEGIPFGDSRRYIAKARFDRSGDCCSGPGKIGSVAPPTCTQ